MGAGFVELCSSKLVKSVEKLLSKESSSYWFFGVVVVVSLSMGELYPAIHGRQSTRGWMVDVCDIPKLAIPLALGKLDVEALLDLSDGTRYFLHPRG